MANYRLPTFNIVANVWRGGNLTSNPPDLTPNANLALGRRVNADNMVGYFGKRTLGTMWLLLPWGTDIRDSSAVSGKDTVEAPAGSGKFYTVEWVDDIGTGFANQHRFAVLQKLGPWLAPFGTGAPPPPPQPPSPAQGGYNDGGIAGAWLPNAFLDCIVTVSGNSIVAVAIAVMNEVLPPTILGATTFGAIANQITDGLNTVNLWQLYLAIAGPGQVTFRVNTGSGLPRRMMVSYMPYSSASGGVPWGGYQVGAFGPPTIVPGLSMSQTPLRAVYVAYATWNPPVQTLGPGYTLETSTPPASGVVAVGNLNKWTMQGVDMLAPPQTPPPPAWGPLFGWQTTVACGLEVTA